MSDDLADLFTKARAAGLSFINVDAAKNFVRVTAWHRSPVNKCRQAHGDDMNATIRDVLMQIIDPPPEAPKARLTDDDIFGDL